MKNIRLKTTLIGNFVLIATAPILVIGFLTLNIFSANMKEDITRKNFMLTQSLTGEVERFLEQPLKILRQIQDVITVTPVIRLMHINAYLESIIRNYQFFEALMILDPEGKVRHLAPYNEDFFMIDMSGQEFFSLTTEQSSPYWSPTFISLQTGQPTLTVSIPFNQGILVGYINLSLLHGIIAKIHIGTQGFAFIVDHDGTIIAHPDHSLVARRVSAYPLSVIQQGRTGQAGAVQYQLHGIEHIGSVVMIPHTHWLVVVTQPLDEAFAPVQRIRNIFWIGISLTTMFALFLALFSVKKTLQPLSQLTDHAKRAAAGSYRLLSFQSHYREVDELTSSFDRMVEAVKSREQALREAEEEVRILNAELGQRVRQRTAELALANRELQDFTYMASHDLKTPLRGISQLAYWLVRDYGQIFDVDGKRMMDLLINRVKRIDLMIDGILQYSRVGQMMTGDEQINLNYLVKNVQEMIPLPAQFRLIIESDLPTLIGDKIGLTQIFYNLIDNAVKFMDKPQGIITIRCREDNSCWIFSVSDNGPGIAQKYHDKIFQIFQTLAARDESESTGMGLALVKKIVTVYGGKIWVESTTGQGSSFFFTFPKAKKT